MSGDWIKMRGALIDHPKVIAMTRLLSGNEAFRTWLAHEDAECPPMVSAHALRCVTTALLMRVWSVARDHGRFDGDDLHLPHSVVTDLDQMAGAPGVGVAMLAVGWIVQRGDIGVHLPNFVEFNVPMTNAEKQKAYRERKAKSLPTQGNEKSKSVTTRLDKRREEEEQRDTPRAAGSSSLFHGEPPTLKGGKPMPRLMTIDELVGEGVCREAAEAWFELRKRKRSPLTAYAWQLIKAEIAKAGFTAEAAVQKAIKRNWVGFEAGWLVESVGSSARPTARSSLAERAAADEETMRFLNGA